MQRLYILIICIIAISGCGRGEHVEAATMAEIFAREFNVCAARAETEQDRLLVLECARERAKKALQVLGRVDETCFDEMVGHWSSFGRRVERGEISRHEADTLFSKAVVTLGSRCAS